MNVSLPSTTQRACCHKTVSRSEAGFCPECGQPAIRCMAHSECGSLLNSRDRCEVCVWPELILDAGAMVDVRRGGVMSLPLTVTNQSPVGLPLFVTAIHVREGLGRCSSPPFMCVKGWGSGNTSRKAGSGLTVASPRQPWCALKT